MSHQEKIERINAELNTSETWARRWQIEREHNERLAAEADKVRTGVQGLRARAIERYGLPGIVLMENAGRAATDALARTFPSALHHVVVVGGVGQNGGDAWVVSADDG